MNASKLGMCTALTGLEIAVIHQGGKPVRALLADMAKVGLGIELDKKLNVPSVPNIRTIAFGTAYQATTPGKSALISIMVETVYNVTLASTLTDTVELRVGSDATTVANGTGGTVVATFKSSLTGIALTVGMANTQRNQLMAIIQPNWYFAVRRVAGTTATVQGAVDIPL